MSQFPAQVQMPFISRQRKIPAASAAGYFSLGSGIDRISLT
jgi:hypothetical protein